MNASLFFLCPTDCLESIVNKNYKGKNYFYTCLGNNSSFDSILLESIRALICRHNIRNIYFVLSEQNKIVVDAMEGQTFPQISGLQDLFNAIKLNKRQSKLFWKTSDSVHPVLSYYLNQKIIQLQANLSCTITQGLTLQGKIYIKSQNKFIDTYPDLVCLRKYSLN
tara:strand:- start:2453 stop:2950 length:498 start_codon:yes stop_codon:yes gene_type:complete